MLPVLALHALQRRQSPNDIAAVTTAANQVSAFTKVDRVRLHVLIYALSNNMTHRLGFASLGAVWRELQDDYAMHGPRQLFHVPQDSLTRSLCWNLVQGAIEVGDAAGVRRLVHQWHISIDDVKCQSPDRKVFSAIEIASGLIQVDVLKVLLDLGADINATGSFTEQSQNIPKGGALYWLMHASEMQDFWGVLNPRPDRRSVMDVLTMLCEAGIHNPAPPRWAQYIRDRDARGTFYNKSWDPIQLKELHDATTRTPFFWIFERVLFADLPLEVALPRQEHSTRAGDNLALLKTLAASSRVISEVNAHNQPTPNAVLEYLVERDIHPSAVRYLAACGCVLNTPDRECPDGQTLSARLHRTLNRKDPRPRRHVRMQNEIISLISRGETQEALVFVRDALEHDSATFWRACLTASDHGDTGENAFLFAALKTQDKVLIETFIELRSDALWVQKSLLQAAWTGKNKETLELLLKSGTEILPDAAHWAIRTGDVVLLTCLVECGLPCTDNNHNLLRLAIGSGSVGLVRWCLALTRENIFALSYPEWLELAPGTHPSVRREILKAVQHGRPPKGWTEDLKQFGRRMAFALHHGDTEEIARWLTLPSLDFHTVVEWEIPHILPNKCILAAVIEAYEPDTHEGFVSLMNKFCQTSRIDQIAMEADEGSYTPLLLALQKPSLSLVQSLVCDFKADVNRPATGGIRRTPLQQAAESCDEATVRWLIDKGALINGPINQRGGATALQLAAMAGNAGIMEILINASDDRRALLYAPAAVMDGRTALEGAAEHGRNDAVKLILDSEPDILDEAAKRNLGRAMGYAQRQGHVDTLELLKAYRSRPALFDDIIELGSDDNSETEEEYGDDLSSENASISDDGSMDDEEF